VPDPGFEREEGKGIAIMADQQQDRRKSQRVTANLKLEVRLPRPDGSLATSTLETINISSSGVYFRSDHFIEPLTKLAMVLDVTVPREGAGEAAVAPVPCEGIVVRTTPEAETEGCADYEVAVFFTHLEAEGSANLERHIALLMDGSD
jgi:hypothetical protein